MSEDPITTGASSVAPFTAVSTSSRASPFAPSNGPPKNAMAASSFMSQSQPFRPNVTSQSAFALSLAVHPFDRDATKPVGTPFSATNSSYMSSVLIRRLPMNTSEEQLRIMTLFSKERVDVELLPPEQSDDVGFRSAILRFESPAGAQEAKSILDGKSNISNDAKMIVEIIGGSSPISGRRYLGDAGLSNGINGASTATSSAASSATSSRQTSRFGASFQSPLEKISPPMNAVYGVSSDLANSEPSSNYQSIFSPQSPIGNHLADRTRISGKSLINNDAADDDETGELLKDPVAYAENGALSAQQRRATAPQIPITSRLAGLSLNTNANMGPSSVPPYAHHGLASLSAHPNTMSPTGMNGSGPSLNYQMGNQHYRAHNFPPVNPADQNPPCNTLYVGNLPVDTSEEELKAMFSKQRGYKRLCFRTKQNGPMCFVEFEDVSFATKALHELYGHMLHNSVKGGIRLSFSKNPLGVRSGQAPGQNSANSMGNMNGMMANAGAGFTSANGPPPGLSAPPGLASNARMAFNNAPVTNNGSFSASPFSTTSSNGWGTPVYHPSMTSSGPGSVASGNNSGFPPFMMGK
ncbi:uncharacterized protein E0L32_011318 [Thyridium curvatum]|uniref:RRM domain-containing protein n=1 Tax=Thyridium curvatum TaxID=1093900 RepID=A0A507BNX7_9PEZI|nr:uncharacterized protein E0L32_011318 [Thyridium curvatum]TPX19001.1 hypothetical protein E0L32_011318 [Thyridium curvatum]